MDRGKPWLWAAGAVLAAASTVWAVTANPPAGAIWTWPGPAGPDWQTPPGRYPLRCSNASGDAALIQAAITNAAALGNTVEIDPAVSCQIAQTLHITTSQTGLACASGWGMSNVNVASTPKCRLTWTGAAGGTMLDIVAPSGATTNDNLYGNSVRGISFYGGLGLAASGLVLKSVRQGMYEGLHFEGFDGGVALDVDVVHATGTTFAVNCDTQWNTFQLISFWQYGRTSTALRLGAWNNATLPNGACNASMNRLTNLNFGIGTGTAMLLDGADNNYFGGPIGIYSYSGGTAVDVSIRYDGALNYPSNTNIFEGISANGAIIARGKTTFPSCASYNGGVTPNACTFANTFVIDAGNGTVIPTVESGADLSWRDSAGRRAEVSRPFVSGCTGLGTGTCAIIAGSQNRAGTVRLDPAGSPAASGLVKVTFSQDGVTPRSVHIGNTAICTFSPLAGSGGWVAPTGQISAQDGSSVTYSWANSGALTAGLSYLLNYVCTGT